ncbi:hypothetical protein [Desertibacillus haloalkaliphilus]|uniref:hypothetical protein n=1 Tax=Desertibacillus haloalkaliphilus TaxID=1328930 RepID=UPI001C271B66|nr:hypothetical protein [Desertibacillus haloalkaliphilus]MBU8908177.1 hypothetical protein [Desertibacillus haloalkaliphilus]
MFRFLFKKKRVTLFSYRNELRSLNQSIERATDEVDAAWVEELMEEKYRLMERVK